MSWREPSQKVLRACRLLLWRSSSCRDELMEENLSSITCLPENIQTSQRSWRNQLGLCCNQWDHLTGRGINDSRDVPSWSSESAHLNITGICGQTSEEQR